MNRSESDQCKVALQVMQQAVSVLAKWVGTNLPYGSNLATECPAVTKAKEIFSWQNQEPSYLRSLFDAVKFGNSKEGENYFPVVAIADSDPSIPYPVKQPPDLSQYKQNLPKLAYTLVRLPDRALDDDFRKSLKSPYNAPYFQAIATWIELLTRKDSHDSNND